MVADAKTGLRLVVQPSGHKSWATRYTFAGRDRKFTLGDFGKIDLAKARKLAADVHLKVAAGADPQADKVTARRRAASGLDKQHLLGAAYEEYREHIEARIAKNKMRPKTYATIRSVFKLVLLPKFSRRALDEIEPGELKLAIAKAGDPQHTHAVARTFFNWCRSELLLKGPSPMDGLKPPASSEPRDRVLTEQEIRWLWRAADKMDYPFGPMLKLLLLTGARRDEVAHMTRSELDLEKRTWTIPAARVKNKREHVVHLSDAAIEILKSLRVVKGKAGYCFTTSGDAPVSGYSKAKEIVDRLMAGYLDDGESIEPWTFHDLRRTCATGMGELGVAIHVIEAALNHVSGKRGGLVGRYQHQTYATERREAFQLWGNHVTALVKAA